MIMQGFMPQQPQAQSNNLGLGGAPAMPQIQKPTMLKQTPTKIEWGKGIGGSSADFGNLKNMVGNATDQLNTANRHGTDFGSEQTRMLTEQDRGLFEDDEQEGLFKALSSYFR